MLAITGTFALPTCATVLRCKKLHLRTGHVEAPVMANTFRFPYLCFCPHSCILIDSLCLSFDFDTIDFQHTSFQNLMVALFWLQILQCLLNLLLISFEKFLDVNTGCRLVKDVNRSSCAAFAEFCGQFDTLCLTTGQCG